MGRFRAGRDACGCIAPLAQSAWDSTRASGEGSVVLGMTLIGGTLAWSVADANEGRRRLDRSWAATVTTPNSPLGSFTGLMAFTRSGGGLESRRLYVPDSPFGSLLETRGAR